MPANGREQRYEYLLNYTSGAIIDGLVDSGSTDLYPIKLYLIDQIPTFKVKRFSYALALPDIGQRSVFLATRILAVSALICMKNVQTPNVTPFSRGQPRKHEILYI